MRLEHRRSGRKHPMGTTDGKYQLGRPTGRCAASDQTLEAGQACMSVLMLDDETGEFQRLDFAIEAWDAQKRPSNTLAQWRSVVPERAAPQRMLVDDEVLLELLGRLEGEEDPRRVAFRFVLALVLLRKRLLTFQSRRETEEGTAWTLRQRGPAGTDQPEWTVIDPGLDDEDVVDLNEQLGEILNGAC